MSRPRSISSGRTSSLARRAGTVVLFLGLAWALTAAAAPCAGQLVSIAIVPFHDGSDAAAPGDLLNRIGRDFRQKLTLSYKDLLPRLVGAEVLPDPAAAGIGDLAALGKQQAARFLVRAGILAITSERSGSDLRCGFQIFADLVDTETQGVTSLRAEGEGVEAGAALEDARHWDAYIWTGPEFGQTALGQAIDAALTSLADQVHTAVLAPPAQGAGQTQPIEGQTPGAAAGGPDPYQTDQELQQLMAQAKSLISGAYAANLDVTPLQQALDGVRSRLGQRNSNCFSRARTRRPPTRISLNAAGSSRTRSTATASRSRPIPRRTSPNRSPEGKPTASPGSTVSSRARWAFFKRSRRSGWPLAAQARTRAITRRRDNMPGPRIIILRQRKRWGPPAAS